MSADLLAVDRVIKSYAFGGLFGRGAFNAVDDVSFSLETARPEIFTIVGESGSGKTTLARMILNLIAPHRAPSASAAPTCPLSAAPARGWTSCAKCSRSFRTRSRPSIP